MPEGVVKWYNEKKGFGFIESEGLGDVFLHKTQIVEHGFFALQKSDRVSFDVRQTDRGPHAVNIKVLRKQK